MKRFPRFLDAPIMVLWFELDTFMIFFFGFGLSLYIHWSFFIIGMVMARLIAIAKRDLPRGFLKQSGYYMGLQSIKGYPCFFENEFHE